MFFISVVTSEVETPDAAPPLPSVRLLVFRVNPMSVSYVLVMPVTRNLSEGFGLPERPLIVVLSGVLKTILKSEPYVDDISFVPTTPSVGVSGPKSIKATFRLSSFK